MAATLGHLGQTPLRSTARAGPYRCSRQPKPVAKMTASAQTAEQQHEHVQLEAQVPRLTVVPLRHTKVLHLIRHGEGFHNVAGRKDHDLYKSFDYEDSHLTPFGWQQAHAVNKHIRASGLKVDVVLVSPLTRALETAVGCFGNLAATTTTSSSSSSIAANGDQQQQELLMVELTEQPGKRAAHAAVPAAGAPPMVCYEECREHIGVHPCDRRLGISSKRAMFPAVDFSRIASEEDPLWTIDQRETKSEIMARGKAFLQMVMQRPEHSIAVVSHSSILHFMLTNFGLEDSSIVQGELHRWFENCELRSVVVTDHVTHKQPDPYAFPGFAAGVAEGPSAPESAAAAAVAVAPTKR